MVGTVCFPLEKEWGVTSSDLTPRAQEGLVRLATWMPDAKAAHVLERVIGVHARTASARRTTVHTGLLLTQEWEQQASHLHAVPTASPAGADRLVFSADGAMVPLVGGM